MKLRSILTVGLLAVVLLIGCTPAAVPEPTQPEAVTQPAPTENKPEVPPPATATISQPEAAPTEAPPTQVLPTEVPTEVPQVVATSRGPNLEATDPASYSRVSGDLQLVEFFAFW